MSPGSANDVLFNQESAVLDSQGGGDATLRYIIPELVLIVGPNTDFNVDMRVGRQTCELTVF